MSNELNISPNMLEWAITRAGYDIEDFITRKFPKVREWLNNTKSPTMRQLEDFSKAVHVPFGYLFLTEPPQEDAPIPFFRTGKEKDNKISLNIRDTVVLLKNRQDWLSELLNDDGEEPLPFVGRFDFKRNPDPLIIAADIRNTLKLKPNWATQFKTVEESKDFLTERIEDCGIVVNYNSVVGNNNTRKIKVEECRGFVLIDEMVPFLFVNSGDSKGAQMFTLAHELVHVWIGKTAGFDLQQMLSSDDPAEKLCNTVAAEFLVPSALFKSAWAKGGGIHMLSKMFKVSPIVIARRALDLGEMNKDSFFTFYNGQINDFEKVKATGGNFHSTQKFRLGLLFMGRLNQALKEGKVLYRDAYRLSGLNGDTYHNFIKHQNL